VARYLVTGGAGFIGSHLASTLLDRGQQVRILDNFATGLRENVALCAAAEVIEGDVRSYHIVAEAMAGVEYVLHQAALPSVPRSVRDPITSNDVNVVGTLNVLQAARDAGVRRLVYASSSSVYGENPELPKHEGMAPAPISPYAVSKLAGEHYCRAFTRLYGLETVMLRYFNVFGPRQNPHSEYAAVVPKFVRILLDGGRPTVFGDGSQSRDFTYVENVVTANLLACQATGVAGRVFNVATGRCVSLLDMLRMMGELTGRRPDPVFAAARPGDIEHSFASITAARDALGYEPAVDVAEGLRRTVAALVA
jgi:UDP-glucose 4-epimerase